MPLATRLVSIRDRLREIRILASCGFLETLVLQGSTPPHSLQRRPGWRLQSALVRRREQRGTIMERKNLNSDIHSLAEIRLEQSDGRSANVNELMVSSGQALYRDYSRHVST
jgi:hypothetical protein